MTTFIRETFLADNCAYLFDIMFNCIDTSGRDAIGRFTAGTINKAFQIVGICSNEPGGAENPKVILLKQTIDEFMTLVLLKLHERDCQKKWMYLK